MKKIIFLMLLACGSASADDAALVQCSRVDEAGKRLACFDALVPGAAKRMAGPTQQQKEQAFGLAEKKPEINTITSSIPGKFDGWEPGRMITLANGQVWRVSDGSSGVVYGTDLKVSLERSNFGGTFMVIQGTNKAPKVTRVR